MFRISKVLVLIAALWLHGSAALRAQSDGDQLATDIRIFTVLTAINMVGYDTGFGSPSDHAVRRVVREALKDFQGPRL